MDPIRSSVDMTTLSAWRGQLAATGARRGVRTQLLQHRQELLPRFAALYRQLRALPRRLRKALQCRWGASLAGVALLLTLQPGVSKAANFTAGTAAELVTALTTANGNGEVDTITLTADLTLDTTDNTTYGPTGLPVVTSAITIAGNQHTIQRGASNPVQFRLLAINNSGNLTLQDTTLSGGSAAGGGDPSNQGEGKGGGIFNNSGQLTLEGCTVSGNSAGGAGGGVAFIASNDGSTVQILNSTVSGNTANDGGGGMLLRASSGSTVQVLNSTVSGNSARNGGGMFVFASSGSTVQILNSTVSGNTANYGGGMFLGAYSAGDNAAVLMNSTVSGNTANYGGGLVLNASFGSTAVLLNSTVSGNSAGYSGGGVYSSASGDDPLTDPGTVVLSRNLLSGNLASTGAEDFHKDLGGSFSATSNLFGHEGLTTAQALKGISAAGTNIIATNDGSKPAALADILDTSLRNNGGPTLTHDLVAGSPAIDAAGATCELTTDQRGAPRPVDGDGMGGAACDIGAVEFGALPSALDCSTATTSVNFPQLGNRHRYKVDILGVAAPDGEPVTLAITSIFQDEPVTSATGTTCPDGIGVGTEVAKVRNERIITQAGDGRVYHIGFTATDKAGASCTGEVQVCVPISPGEGCGDQGARFDSTTCP